mmetsp:Transcript_23059/g.37939  ORF Transcript_23059/g.37939 Transcript_23059/m.37939 type:complete len:349 (+) Transcript_23059:87-1133(+)
MKRLGCLQGGFCKRWLPYLGWIVACILGSFELLRLASDFACHDGPPVAPLAIAAEEVRLFKSESTPRPFQTASGNSDCCGEHVPSITYPPKKKFSRSHDQELIEVVLKKRSIHQVLRNYEGFIHDLVIPLSSIPGTSNEHCVLGTFESLWAANPVDMLCNSRLFGNDEAGSPLCTEMLGNGMSVYSFGSGIDTAFEEGLMELLPGLQVYAFDPTPSVSELAVQKKGLPANFHYIPWGLAGFDGEILIEGTQVHVFRLESIMTKLSHTRCDILRLDIQGYEWQVLDDVIALNASQVVITFNFFDAPQPEPFHWWMAFQKFRTHGYAVADRKSRQGHHMWRAEYLFIHRT